MSLEQFRNGICGDLDAWIDFNRTGAFQTPGGLDVVAPFPPTELMQNTSGLTRQDHFASHGCDILQALRLASPKPLASFTDILDFGVGVGRLARMFKGTRGKYTGVDVDTRHVAWVSETLDYVNAIATTPRKPFPFERRRFDCVISISVFTHMNEKDQFFYLSELARITQPGATLMLTVHGERALKRAETEKEIFAMLAIPSETVEITRRLFPTKGFNFILQHGHLTSQEYDYGITFTGEDYIKREWSKYFDVVRVVSGAIHDFQDIVVLQAR
jgi:SAM-dependent methyltransferase